MAEESSAKPGFVKRDDDMGHLLWVFVIVFRLRLLRGPIVEVGQPEPEPVLALVREPAVGRGVHGVDPISELSLDILNAGILQRYIRVLSRNRVLSLDRRGITEFLHRTEDPSLL